MPPFGNVVATGKVRGDVKHRTSPHIAECELFMFIILHSAMWAMCDVLNRHLHRRKVFFKALVISYFRPLSTGTSLVIGNPSFVSEDPCLWPCIIAVAEVFIGIVLGSCCQAVARYNPPLRSRASQGGSWLRCQGYNGHG